ncbi:hypothetical protein JST97_04250 [bacterium]|nr:hypothetical protein [bacterium]
MRGRGFSLLETVLAAFLFATISISLISLWLSHYRLQAQTQHRVVAQYVCKQMMEELLSQPVSTIVPVPRGSKPSIVIDSMMNGHARRVVYDFAVTCVNTANTKDVTVQVFWSEGKMEHEFHLETMLFSGY